MHQITSTGQRVYSIVEPRVTSDAYGLFKYDYFFGKMRVYLTLPDRSAFPTRWKTCAQTKFILSHKFEEKSNSLSHILENSVDGFLSYVASLSSKRDEVIAIWKQALEKDGVSTLDDIGSWVESNWNSSQLNIEGRRLLRQNIHSYINQSGVKKEHSKNREKAKFHDENERKRLIYANDAMVYSTAHAILRYLHYKVGDNNKGRPYLDPEAVYCAFQSMGLLRDISTGELLIKLQAFVENFCNNPALHMTVNEMGILLFGPPGTGKTRICEELTRLCGFFEVVEPLASSDMNRPHVGETEEVLRALFNRANKMPHLICCIAIDEIDSLTPKRSQKVSEHAISALSTILALMGGIKKVKNICVFASTNRMNVMDDAVLRRLTCKEFVGRPSKQQRKSTFEYILDANLGLKFEKGALEMCVILTANYSGAALNHLRSKLISTCKELTQTDTITTDIVIHSCKQISKSFQITIGTYSLVNLFEEGFRTAYPLSSYLPEKVKLSGRCIVDISQTDGFSTILFEHGSMEEVTPIQFGRFRISKKAIPTVVSFAMDRDLDFVQLIDDDVLTSNAAFDEQTIMETLTERIQECRGYSKSMLVIDLDALVGLSVSENVSNMGPSTSYSFVKQNLFSWVCSVLNRAEIVGQDIEHWVVVIVSNPFSAQSLKTMVKFPKTLFEQNRIKEQTKEENDPVTCYVCRQRFLRSENKFGDCRVHTENPKLTATKEERESYIHPCCFQKYSPGSPGCTLDWHKYDEY
eukprot:TRINITY_DN1697_c0_g1_i1.p1 TRINITY_DN1697_c0_g1~~TRINITY_DN1697_c0_g1_i1.p1  ORF type:complete len:752 (+),score=53.28 TRINITY_DN1697_c0_g1_i1:329-2584(+)